jgi:hypothetical protein
MPESNAMDVAKRTHTLLRSQRFFVGDFGGAALRHPDAAQGGREWGAVRQDRSRRPTEPAAALLARVQEKRSVNVHSCSMMGSVMCALLARCRRHGTATTHRDGCFSSGGPQGLRAEIGACSAPPIPEGKPRPIVRLGGAPRQIPAPRATLPACNPFLSFLRK